MTKNQLKYSLVMLGLALGTCSAAYGFAFGPNPNPHVPEIDPSLAIGGLTLLAGSIAVLRIRRRK